MWRFDNHWPLAACLTLVLLLGYGPATLADDPTHDAFTYQGLLTQGGAPVTGPVNYAFRLYNAPAGGGQVGPEIEAIGFNAFDDEGRFTIDLEFGKGVFDGTPLWLEVRVNGAPLAPRQPIMPTPYSIRALNVAAVSDPALAGTYTNALNFTNAGNTFAGSFSGSGAGLTNLNAASISSGTLSAAHAPTGGNWTLITNLNVAGDTFVVNPSNNRVGIGTGSPQALLHVAEGTSGTGLILPGLRVFQNATSPNVIGGFSGNTVEDGVVGATIGGGGRANLNEINRVTGDYGTIGGGFRNTAGALSTVGGGADNAASGTFSTVGGGISNSAQGDYSFAAGSRAKADHDGAFVWADSSTIGNFTSQRDNHFRVRANGGARFDVNGDHWVDLRHQTLLIHRVIHTSTGAYLSAGGTWTNSSDRDAKDGFAPVDPVDVLHRVTSLPILTWHYKAESPENTHMGPTAQDFHALFGLGGDKQAISTVDADGVALAAIQGLHQIVRENEMEIESLREEVVELRRLVSELLDREMKSR